jgi:serine/threonine protein phosphatase PrpC
VNLEDAWTLDSVVLDPGDSFICLSDGLLDLFGSIEEAREATCATVASCSGPEEVVQVVLDYARDHLASDDATVVVVRRDPL